MSTSVVRGWRAAARYTGKAPTTLRRLVERGTLAATLRGGVHEFDEADLVPLANTVAIASASTAESTFEHSPVERASPCTTSPDGDDQVRELLRAAARERAETERINAELERLHAQQQLADLRAVQREQRRLQQTERIVSRTTDALPSNERDQVAEHLREALLDLPDLDDDVAVGGLVRRTVDTVRVLIETARQEALERTRSFHQRRINEQAAARPATTAPISPPAMAPAAWRENRIGFVVNSLACELVEHGYPSEPISHATSYAWQRLAQLDDRVLSGASWPHFAARVYASLALDLVPPSPPTVWDQGCGWRSLQPGE